MDSLILIDPSFIGIVAPIPAKLLLVGRNNWQYILWMGQRPTIFDQHSMSDTIKFNLNSKRQSTSTSLVSSQPGDKGGTTFIWLEKEKKMYTYNKDNSLYEPTTIGPS